MRISWLDSSLKQTRLRQRFVQYKSANRKGKSAHTIVSQPGKQHLIYIALDTSTIIVTPYPIISVSNPARDIIQTTPEITADSPGNNFVAIKVAPAPNTNFTSDQILGTLNGIHIMCEGGYTITIKTKVTKPTEANRDIYIIDPKQLEKRKKISREDEIKAINQAHLKTTQDRELVLSNLFFYHDLAKMDIDKDVSYKGKTASLKSVLGYSNYLVFNLKIGELKYLIDPETVLLEIEKISGTGLLKRKGDKEVYDLDSMISYESINEPFVSLIFKINKPYYRFYSSLRIGKLIFDADINFNDFEEDENVNFDIW